MQIEVRPHWGQFDILMPGSIGDSSLSSADMNIWVWGKGIRCMGMSEGSQGTGERLALGLEYGSGGQSFSSRDPAMLQVWCSGGRGAMQELECTRGSWREGPGKDQVGAQG